MAITTEDIFRIADELDANGQSPTLAAVRKQLGGGSFTTISEAMAEWKARKSAKECPALREPAPQAVTDRLGELGTEIWSLALGLANGRLATEREALEITRVELEASKAEAADLADQVSAELEALQGKVAALETAEQVARDEAEGLRGKLTALAERAATAEARAVEIERRADDLNAELARVNQQNSDLVKALAESAAGKKD
jgi:chromosome segregation ATPase